jgi:hypothetical protein
MINPEVLESIQKVQSITGLPSEVIGRYVNILEIKSVPEEKIGKMMEGIIGKNKELGTYPGEQTKYGQYMRRFVENIIKSSSVLPTKGVVFQQQMNR